MKRNILVITFTLTAFVFAQNNTRIVGQVTDAQSNNAINGANIYLQHTMYGSTSDEQGNFEINNIPSGNYTIITQFVGYKDNIKELIIEEGKTTTISFSLKPSPLLANEIVVSATRTEKYRRDVPVIVNIADEKTMKISQSANVAEGLSFIPGVRTENNCQNCGFTQVRLNGLEGPYSQILINSRPVFSSLNGVYGLEQIPSNLVERVEVIRGGGSALFGSNAIAGVINIITREPHTRKINFSTQQTIIGGKAHDQSYNLASSFVNKERNLGISLFGNSRTRDHYDHNGDSFSELGQLDNKAIGLRGYYRPSGSSKISFDSHYLYEDRRGGNKFNLKPHQADIAEATTHNVFGSGLSYEKFFSSKKLQKLAFYTNAQYTNRDSYYGAGQDPDAYGNTNEIIVLAGAQYSHAVLTGSQSKHEITLGVESRINDMQDEQPSYDRFLDQEIFQSGFFVQDDWKINSDFSFLYGFRVDKHNKLDDLAFNPRANLLVNLYPQLQFRASYARGFRAPQAFDEDLHLANVAEQKTNIITLDTNLKPEISNSFSLSLDYSDLIGLPWGITLEAFYTNLDDVFINEYNSENDEVVYFEKRNGAGAIVEGLTLETRAYLNQEFEVQSGLTLQRSRYTQASEWADGLLSKRILKTPEIYGFFLTRWEALPDFDISLSGVYTGSMYVPHFAGFISDDRLEKTPDFFETNLKLSYKLEINDSQSSVFYVGFYNLFNQYQEDFDKGVDRDPGYVYGPNRPISFFGGIEFILN